MYKYNNLKMPIGYTNLELKEALERATGAKVTKIRLLKKSIDARKNNDIHYTISLAFQCDGKLSLEEYIAPISRLSQLATGIGMCKTTQRVAIVGSGPCGLFAALTLANFGVGVDIYERGCAVEDRRKSVLTFQKSGDLDENSNIQFGEGGAGTFSDGKLNTGTKSEYAACVHGEFIANGADPDIAYSAKPHIGTDVLVGVVSSMRKEIIRLGGRVMFNAKVDDIVTKADKIVGIKVNGMEHEYQHVVLACGHSARDTYQMLHSRGVDMDAKPFAIGARIEHHQGLIDIAQYGKSDPSLPPADYKLAGQVSGGRNCFTFCMCPGGEIITAASEKGGVVTNGMSRRSRDSGYANSAVLVNVDPKDFGEGVLSGIDFQRRWESRAYSLGDKYSAPAVYVKDFVDKRESVKMPGDCTSYARGVYAGKFSQCLPDYVINGMIEGIRLFGRKIRSFDSQGVLVGVETRSSAPVWILRDQTMMSNIRGLYPSGEGSGYAGGITSSAVDGIKVALAVIANLKK